MVAKLAKEADVLIENFKPGTMEKWGLGPDDLEQENPNLIYVRVSGYGQTALIAKNLVTPRLLKRLAAFDT